MIFFFSFLFFFKKKKAYEMRISDWSSDVCSSDLRALESSVKRTLSVTGSLPGSCASSASTYWVTSPPRHARSQSAAEAGSEDRSTMARKATNATRDRKSVVEGKRVSVRVDLGGRRIIKKNKQQDKQRHERA